ncbi:cleavage induced hypothetical protein [Thraustotheca clavata]|uniref:Uncharacterized protein n=1 Tax=Thraustotheca clavata TaxID=74557 RepID=A0A1W0A047_9STRA|nr:cleavage induced hypothetical protein [Thraustotheca clavata]
MTFGPSSTVYKALSYNKPTAHKQDSSILAIDKRRAANAMLVLWKLIAYQRHHMIYSWGDKENFWLAYELSHTSYSFSPGRYAQEHDRRTVCGDIAQYFPSEVDPPKLLHVNGNGLINPYRKTDYINGYDMHFDPNKMVELIQNIPKYVSAISVRSPPPIVQPNASCPQQCMYDLGADLVPDGFREHFEWRIQIQARNPRGIHWAMGALVLTLVALTLAVITTEVVELPSISSANTIAAPVKTPTNTNAAPVETPTNTKGALLTTHSLNFSEWESLPVIPQKNARKLAYFFYATDDGQACNALIAAKKLRILGTPQHIDMVVMIISEVTNRTQEVLLAGGLIPLRVDPWRIESDHGIYRDSLTKLRIFEEHGYDRVIYIDSDTVIQKNLDELFNLPHAVFWAPRAYWLLHVKQPIITSVLLVVDPDNSLFQELEHAISVQPEVEYDMDILNIWWRQRFGILPSEFVVLTTHLQEEMDSYLFGYKDLQDRINHTYIHHFSRSEQFGKPWQMNINTMERRPDIIPLFYDLYQEYWDRRREYCIFL